MPVKQSGAGDDDAGWVLSLQSTPIRFGFPLICDPGARYEEPGPDYCSPRSPARQTRDKIRDIQRLNPGKKVILADAGPEAGAVA